MSILTRSQSYKTRAINALARVLGGCVQCGEYGVASDFSPRLCQPCSVGVKGRFGQQQRCQTCAAPLETVDMKCLDCLIDPPLVTRTLAFSDYSHTAQHLILNYKLHHHLSNAPLLADALSAVLRQQYIVPDIVIAVPQHDSMTRARGFIPLTHVINCIDWRRLYPHVTPHIDPQASIRLHHQHLQVGASAAERHRQVKGAFAITRDLTGSHVLLIDDVYTTGATLNELARMCLAAGAKEVSNLVIARARLVK